ncbi:hypothetical protein Scani_39590 [Streptomyces caniferus]|uniref:Uncharacterized protein n=1 Tax=Streptomyces caniferus TaxID=285557 RepID=A0A640SB84_9ACTN|nr:hypothetical protein Scani_39590 [Streptomyces caniferus]
MITPLLPPAVRARGRWRDHRQVLEGIVFNFRHDRDGESGRGALGGRVAGVPQRVTLKASDMAGALARPALPMSSNGGQHRDGVLAGDVEHPVGRAAVDVARRHAVSMKGVVPGTRDVPTARALRAVT